MKLAILIDYDEGIGAVYTPWELPDDFTPPPEWRSMADYAPTGFIPGDPDEDFAEAAGRSAEALGIIMSSGADRKT